MADLAVSVLDGLTRATPLVINAPPDTTTREAVVSETLTASATTATGRLYDSSGTPLAQGLHPRLMITATEIASEYQPRFSTGQGFTDWQALVTQAASQYTTVAYGVPDQKRWINVACVFALIGHMDVPGINYGAGGTAANYLTKAAEVCRAWMANAVPPGYGLGSSNTDNRIALFFDWIAPALTTEERATAATMVMAGLENFYGPDIGPTGNTSALKKESIANGMASYAMAALACANEPGLTEPTLGYINTGLGYLTDHVERMKDMSRANVIWQGVSYHWTEDGGHGISSFLPSLANRTAQSKTWAETYEGWEGAMQDLVDSYLWLQISHPTERVLLCSQRCDVPFSKNKCGALGLGASWVLGRERLGDTTYPERAQYLRTLQNAWNNYLPSTTNMYQWPLQALALLTRPGDYPASDLHTESFPLSRYHAPAHQGYITSRSAWDFDTGSLFRYIAPRYTFGDYGERAIGSWQLSRQGPIFINRGFFTHTAERTWGRFGGGVVILWDTTIARETGVVRQTGDYFDGMPTEGNIDDGRTWETYTTETNIPNYVGNVRRAVLRSTTGWPCEVIDHDATEAYMTATKRALITKPATNPVRATKIKRRLVYWPTTASSGNRDLVVIADHVGTVSTAYQAGWTFAMVGRPVVTGTLTDDTLIARWVYSDVTHVESTNTYTAPGVPGSAHDVRGTIDLLAPSGVSAELRGMTIGAVSGVLDPAATPSYVASGLYGHAPKTDAVYKYDEDDTYSGHLSAAHRGISDLYFFCPVGTSTTGLLVCQAMATATAAATATQIPSTGDVLGAICADTVTLFSASDATKLTGTFTLPNDAVTYRIVVVDAAGGVSFDGTPLTVVNGAAYTTLTGSGQTVTVN